MHSGPVSFEFMYKYIYVHTPMYIVCTEYLHEISSRYQKKYARLLKLDYVRDTVPRILILYYIVYIYG